MEDRFKDATGHVVTAHLAIVQLEVVRKDMQAERKCRNNTEQGGGADIRELVEWSIGACANASSKSHDVPPSIFNEWIELMVKKVNQKADEMQTPTRAGGKHVTNEQHQEHAAQVDKAVKTHDAQVKTLRRKFVDLEADKAASTYALVCKSHLARQMMEEVTMPKTHVKYAPK